MRFKGFCGQAYTLPSTNVSAQRCVNLYPERQADVGKEGEQIYLKSTPGLRQILTVGDGPIRLLHRSTSGRIFCVSGSKVYLIENTGTGWTSRVAGANKAATTPLEFNGLTEARDTLILAFNGEENNGEFTVVAASFADSNGLDNTVFFDALSQYSFIESASDWAFTNNLLGNPAPLRRGVTWIDGRFIVIGKDTNEFYVSNINSFTIDELSFASAEGFADPIVQVARNHRDLWLFGETTIEIFTNTGNSDFPFERIPGGFLEVGCAAKRTVAKAGDLTLGKMIWLGQTENGDCIVYMATGTNPQRISTHAIEHAIKGYADVPGATAFVYQEGGHEFYVLNFDEATWVYDITTQSWHERSSLIDGTAERWRAGHHVWMPERRAHIIGDYSSNKIFLLDDSYYKDGTYPIQRIRSAPVISAAGKFVSCAQFQLDMETGVGLQSGQGSNPKLVIRWSDDGGHNWSNEIEVDAGAAGEFERRAIARKLGRFRNRVFEVRYSEPTPFTIIGANVELEGK